MNIRKAISSLFLIVVSVVYSGNILDTDTQQDQVLRRLYGMMESKETFMSEKEGRISAIKMMLATPNISNLQQYEINLQLYNEYKTYISDSAIHYAKQNVELAGRLGDRYRMNESKLSLTSLYIISGLYVESLDILNQIDRSELTDNLLIYYYDSYKQLYRNYSFNNPNASVYIAKSSLYRDSLLNVLNKESNHYRIVLAEKLFDENRLTESKQILEDLINQSEEENHEKAVLTYALATIYREEGIVDKQITYFAISAICDIRNAIMENASMQALAVTLFEIGNIEKAYDCIKSSMEDAMFCNARLRTYEISQILPIIDSAYQERVRNQKSELQLFLYLVSLLSLFLIIAVIYVYRQMKKITRIRKELYHTNLRLNELNEDLQRTVDQLNDTNKKMSDINDELSESNEIKETYIGHFLDLCSTYIDKLEKYRSTLNKKAVERKLEELFRMLKSHEMIDQELKELYSLFDNIFLHLYPNFVEEFNSLLVEEERFNLKPDELLNTELRIFALIRLGITDSSRIANFLRYSANTIYNYRTRVRNKAAVPRDKFESFVMKIGVIQKI
ncbi:MAG: hypothetical protein A2W86_06875 [Bacteroidetes bacterium GWD2_45_23]|jgi:hypothetical protein|nr:MAG: hypothetical protein A2W87_01655 [Bacteroidetes bacterium GWC2_46_850]OFX80275.1 MAG: hypothetical protein A2071_05545 [Bacteroidetes bacterium GWC1_47_7]OFX82985.1 MAG: hypothetical protein A2W86_06875 [Bacteroidetes bacterium GWD2_45_23]